MSKTFQDLALIDLTPPSIAGDRKIQALADGAWRGLAEVYQNIPVVRILARLAELPEPVVDLLGWQFHVDHWDTDLTLKEKRRLVAESIDWHRKKGTVAGYRLAAERILKRRLLAWAPDRRYYWGRDLTDDEWAAWESVHPEIRIYPFREDGQKVGFYWGDFWGPMFYTASSAMERIGDDVEIFDPLTGTAQQIDQVRVDRETVARTAQAVVQVRLPASQTGLYWGDVWGGAFTSSTARARFYTIRMAREYQTTVERRTAMSITPALEPMTGYFRWEREVADAGMEGYLGGRFPLTLGGNQAGDRLRKVMKLFDPDRAELRPRHDGGCFWGSFIWDDYPPHTGLVAVDMVDRRTKGMFWGEAWGDRCFAMSRAAAKVERTRGVLELVRRCSDQVAIKINNRKTITVGQAVLGEAVLGQHVISV